MSKTLGHKVRCTVNAPCHPGNCWHLQAWSILPREEYVRHCPTCGKRWEIMRKRLIANDQIAAHEFEFVQFDAAEGIA
jgi:hypothetical protein